MPIRVQISLPRTSGLPEDIVVNTWHLNALESAVDDELTGVAFAGFYNSISDYISPEISRVVDTSIDLYDLADPEPRVPFASGSFSLGDPPLAIGLPSEVAICTSFQAAPQSGQPQARRRGRVFIGPLATGALEPGAGERPVVSPFFQTLLALATETLSTVLFTQGTPLGIYSRRDNVCRTATNGWVDNAFDTQRRRGVVPTSRTAWSQVD